jgi:nucleotide-binding universal stress UspA family protein
MPEEKELAMKRILVAYDGGEPAHRALDTAIDLATHLEGLITVVSVVPVHPGVGPMYPWDDDQIHAAALEEARRILAERGMTAELLEPIGDPARTIERIAEDGGFDTIVVGSRRLGQLSRFVQGSVSSHVASHANATVVVAR